MKQFLHNDKDIDKIFNVFDRFKIIIQKVFNVTNETVTFIGIIQHLSQKTSTIDYVQRFKKHTNNISWNDKTLIIMFYKDLKSNVKDKIIKKEMQYMNLDALIFAVINIDDNWYERILKNRLEKSMRNEVNIHHDELIRREEDYYWKKRNHDDKIVFIKIDFIEYRKRKSLKNEQKKRFKDEKKCYNCDKKDHFARDGRSKNKKNQQQINGLIKISDKTEVQEKKSETDISEVSTNDEYYRIKNVDKL